MAQKLYDVVVKTGEYQKNGETKGRYENIGVVMQGDNGPYIMLKRTFNPAGVPDLKGNGGDTVLVSLFEPSNNGQQPQQPQQAPAQGFHQPPQGGFNQQPPAQQAPQQGGFNPNNAPPAPNTQGFDDDFSDSIPF